MSFIDGKRWTITQEDLDGRWGTKKGSPGEGLRCGLCGELPVLGATWRWVYANFADGAQGGNFFVCRPCDPEQDNKAALAKRRALYDELNRLHLLFWWSDHCPKPEDFR